MVAPGRVTRDLTTDGTSVMGPLLLLLLGGGVLYLIWGVVLGRKRETSQSGLRAHLHWRYWAAVGAWYWMA